MSLLTACGGGGGGSGDPSLPSSPSIGYAEGDSYTYEVVRQYFSNSSTPVRTDREYMTYTISNPQANLEHDRIQTSSMSPLLVSRISSTNTTVSSVRGDMKCTYSNAKYNPGFAANVGDAWNTSHEIRCTDGTEVFVNQVDVKGKVTLKEPYQTDAGTFGTFKAESERLIWTPGTSATQTGTYSRYDCWYDEKTGALVTCSGDIKQGSDPGAAVGTRVITKLIGQDVKGHPVRSLRVERFTGRWKWTFADQQFCDVTIYPDGVLNGDCYQGSSTVAQAMEGTVSVDGTVTAQTPDGSAYAGSLKSAVTGQGTWRNPTGASGTWTARHN